MHMTIPKLEKRTRQLEAFRYRDMQPITPMKAMAGGLADDGVYTSPPANIQGMEINIDD